MPVFPIVAQSFRISSWQYGRVRCFDGATPVASAYWQAQKTGAVRWRWRLTSFAGKHDGKLRVSTTWNEPINGIIVIRIPDLAGEAVVWEVTLAADNKIRPARHRDKDFVAKGSSVLLRLAPEDGLTGQPPHHEGRGTGCCERIAGRQSPVVKASFDAQRGRTRQGRARPRGEPIKRGRYVY